MSYVVNISRATGIQKIYFNAIVVPDALTDLWAASWYPTDPTAIDTKYAAESLGNVNFYTYVKPMIHINDCISDGGYQHSTVAQFINGTYCGGLVRIDGIINKLKELPSGKRSYRTMRYDNGPIYGEVGDRYANGRQSPWAENAGITVSSDITAFFTRLGNSGAIPDYILIDGEQSGLVFGFPYGPSVDWTNQIYGITSDAKFNQTWYGSTSFNNLYTQGGSYAFGFTNLVNAGSYHPQNTREYLFWDRATQAIHSAFLNQFMVTPLRNIYPSVKISNYGSQVILDGGTAGNAYDINGHPIVRTGIVGDYAAPEIYAGWSGAVAGSGVLNSDTTRIVRKDYAATTEFDSNPWNHLLILLQKIRAVKRGSAGVAITPWIASPYYIGNAPGFDTKWLQSATALGLYYESIRHFALTGVKMFNYYNDGEEDATKLNAGGTALNGVLTELNTILGGAQTTSLKEDERIDFVCDYIISGAPNNRGTYSWRVTPKPGFVVQTLDRFPIETDNDGGAWIETATATPPGLTLTLESRFVKLRQNDLTKRFYSYIFVAVETGVTLPSKLIFDGFNYISKATFMGKPDSGYGSAPRVSRAYPFEYNPTNPKTSSPWHNVIYERFIEDYSAGMRAISIHFPWSTAFSGISGMNSWLLQPLDMLHGTTGFTFMYPRAGLCGYTNGYDSTTEPEWCQARVKGFSGAIKQLLEGTMSPSGRTGITQACDVMIYTPSLDGWPSYRNQKQLWWDKCAGTSAERDATLNARIDQYVNELLVPMKATTATGGILSVSLDVGSYAATPADIHLWRTLPDYRSDDCELSSWYFRGKLEENGIYCYTEARGQTQWNQIDLGYGKVGTVGITAATGVKSIVGDENYFWFSDPDLGPTVAKYADTYFKDRSYIRNRNIPVVHRLTGSYVTLGARMPWQYSTEAVYGGYTMEQYLANFADPDGSHYSYSMVYSPYWPLSAIYAGADIYNDYLYRTTPGIQRNEIWGARRALTQFSTLAIDVFQHAGWNLINQGRCAGIGGLGASLSHDYTWWNPVTAPYTNIMPLFYGFGFTTSAASKTVSGYPTVNYTGGFWTDASVSWWNSNVRGSTLGTLLNIFKDLAMRYNPTGAPDPPYNIDAPSPAPYPYLVWGKTDPYWENGVDSTIR